jgi:hypothetical protein
MTEKLRSTKARDSDQLCERFAVTHSLSECLDASLHDAYDLGFISCITTPTKRHMQRLSVMEYLKKHTHLKNMAAVGAKLLTAHLLTFVTHARALGLPEPLWTLKDLICSIEV